MATVVRSEKTRRSKQKVPNLVGLLDVDAKLVLRHRGFFDPRLIGTPEEGEAYVNVRFVKSFAPYGTVVQQRPTRGQLVDSDSAIELTVSMESLADYLPSLYRRKTTGGYNYIEEFLWIFQHVFHSIESKIGSIHQYFDIFDAPEEFLPWLSGWVAFTLDGGWSEAERRLFLKEAVELYRIRGTVKGLKTFIKMYTGTEANIIENDWPLNGFQIGVASTIGPDSAILPPINRAHCFIVEVPLDPDELEDQEIIKIHQIIQNERPAHTTYYLRFTGKPKAIKRWTGPVIGQYVVTSATVIREEPPRPATPEPSEVVETTEAAAPEAEEPKNSAGGAARRLARRRKTEAGEAVRTRRRRSSDDDETPKRRRRSARSDDKKTEGDAKEATPTKTKRSRRSAKSDDDAKKTDSKKTATKTRRSRRSATKDEDAPKKTRRRRSASSDTATEDGKAKTTRRRRSSAKDDEGESKTTRRRKSRRSSDDDDDKK